MLTVPIYVRLADDLPADRVKLGEAMVTDGGSDLVELVASWGIADGRGDTYGEGLAGDVSGQFFVEPGAAPVAGFELVLHPREATR